MSWYHQIRPQVYDYLKTHMAGEVPGEVMDRFREAHRENALRQMRLMGELLRLLGIFHESGIEMYPYKGVATGHLYYAGFGEREGRDIDVMVHARDLERIRKVMLGEGYVQEGVQGRLSGAYIRRNMCEMNYDYMVDGQRAYHVEMHWRPVGPPHGYDLWLGDLENRLVERPVQGRVMPTFDATGHLVLSSMHHGGKESWSRMKYLLDVAAILRSGEAIDWEWFWATADRFDARRAFGTGLLLANRVLGQALPQGAEAGMDRGRLTRLADRLEADLYRPQSEWTGDHYYLRRWRYQLAVRDGWRRKAAIGWHVFRAAILAMLVPGRVRRWLVKARYGG